MQNDPTNVFQRVWNLSYYIGLLLATLSVFKLAVLSFKFGLAKAFALVLGLYESVAGIILDPLKPWIDYVVREVFGWHLYLNPHWKHVFILLLVYCGTRARTVSRLQARGTAVVLAALGVPIALASGVAAGFVNLNAASENTQANVLVFTAAFVGILVFEVFGSAWAAIWWRSNPCDTWFRAFLRNLPGDLNYLVWGVGAIVLELKAHEVPYIRDLPNPGFLLVCVLMLGVSVYWIAYYEIWRRRPSKSDDWWRLFRRTNNASFGRAILIVFGAAGLALLFNAGLMIGD